MSDLLKQLHEQRKDIESKIEEEEERLITINQNKVIKKLESLTDDEKKVILSHLRHSCSSCSDENPCNGFSYFSETYRCSKCMLIEIFNGEHGGYFDFDLDVTISEVGLI